MPVHHFSFTNDSVIEQNMLTCSFGKECRITLVVSYSQKYGGEAVFCNNYIKNVSETGLKWNKHECLMYPCIIFLIPSALLLRNCASENL